MHGQTAGERTIQHLRGGGRRCMQSLRGTAARTLALQRHCCQLHSVLKLCMQPLLVPCPEGPPVAVRQVRVVLQLWHG